MLKNNSTKILLFLQCVESRSSSHEICMVRGWECDAPIRKTGIELSSPSSEFKFHEVSSISNSPHDLPGYHLSTTEIGNGASPWFQSLPRGNQSRERTPSRGARILPSWNGDRRRAQDESSDTRQTAFYVSLRHRTNQTIETKVPLQWWNPKIMLYYSVTTRYRVASCSYNNKQGRKIAKCSSVCSSKMLAASPT
jgi:hypothetical protein